MIIPDYRLPIGALKSQIMNEISKCQSERLTRIESFLLSQEFEKEWTADGVYNKVVKEIEEFLPYLGNKYRN
jgi:hypothetical protein